MLTGALQQRGDDELLARLRFEYMGVTLAYTRRPSPRGLGDAVLRAEGHTGDAPFAVALGDAIFGTREPPGVVARLGAALAKHGAACAIAVREVPRAQTGRYGIVSVDPADEHADVARVTAIVEKPDPATAPRTLAVSARYVLTPAIFQALRDTPPAFRTASCRPAAASSSWTSSATSTRRRPPTTPAMPSSRTTTTPSRKP